MLCYQIVCRWGFTPFARGYDHEYFINAKSLVEAVRIIQDRIEHSAGCELVTFSYDVRSVSAVKES